MGHFSKTAAVVTHEEHLLKTVVAAQKERFLWIVVAAIVAHFSSVVAAG